MKTYIGKFKLLDGTIVEINVTPSKDIAPSAIESYIVRNIQDVCQNIFYPNPITAIDINCPNGLCDI